VSMISTLSFQSPEHLHTDHFGGAKCASLHASDSSHTGSKLAPYMYLQYLNGIFGFGFKLGLGLGLGHMIGLGLFEHACVLASTSTNVGSNSYGDPMWDPIATGLQCGIQ
jgi:hypothetical protein